MTLGSMMSQNTTTMKKAPVQMLNPAALVDFDAYEKLVKEVKEHRASRLLNLSQFVQASKSEKVIILDTRSDSMYASVHIKGAVHLNFSDFTQENLAKVIPSTDYKILIYCNNNFNSLPVGAVEGSRDYTKFFATKAYIPVEQPVYMPSSSGKEITLALNIPTYINLYGYGYRHIYELSELVNTNDNKIEFEGTAVK